MDNLHETRRPKAIGKRPRKRRGMKHFSDKLAALLAYEGATRGKKIATASEVYNQLTGEVPKPGTMRQHRKRAQAQLMAEIADLIAKRQKTNVTDK